MAAIEILDLEKSYLVGFWRKRPKVALRALRLTIEEGEVFGFLGPNGAGKTTTLKLLMGLVFPTAGTARLLGFDLDDPRVKSKIGFLPEQPYFYDHLSARELLNYYGQLSGVPAKGRSARVEQMLARVGLTDSAGVQLRKFSKGMLQRVGLAQAILHDPELVSGSDSAVAARRQDGIFLDAHFVGCRGALRSRWRDPSGGVARRGFSRGLDV
jgi:ABC-2 type transport system ATP-binding protein